MAVLKSCIVNQKEADGVPFPSSNTNDWPWNVEGIADWVGRWREKRDGWPRVSIVMPFYNQGGFIKEAIRSAVPVMAATP